MSGVVFDASISLGNLITILFGGLVWVVTLAVAWSKFGGRIDLLDLRVELIEKAVGVISASLATLAENKTTLALLNQEITAMEVQVSTLHSTVEGLRRGEGFIQSPRRGGVDGEYSRGS